MPWHSIQCLDILSNALIFCTMPWYSLEYLAVFLSILQNACNIGGLYIYSFNDYSISNYHLSNVHYHSQTLFLKDDSKSSNQNINNYQSQFQQDSVHQTWHIFSSTTGNTSELRRHHACPPSGRYFLNIASQCFQNNCGIIFPPLSDFPRSYFQFLSFFFSLMIFLCSHQPFNLHFLSGFWNTEY